MHLVDKHKILVAADRQRQEFDEPSLRELAHSIQKVGLIHPLVVESLENPVLRAGERRLRAITKYVDQPYWHNNISIPDYMVPVTVTGELNAEQREELELDENVKRVDLTWQEKHSALARLHKLRERQAAAVGEKQTFTDTAREVARVAATEVPPASTTLAVRNATLLAPFLDDPDVKGAKNEREALAVVRRKLTAQFQSRLAQNFDASKSRNPHSLIRGDCRGVLKDALPDSFDVIIADPPYGIDAHKMSPLSGSDSGQTHTYDDSFDYAQEVWWSILSDGAQACKPQAHLYMFCDIRHWLTISTMAKSAGWKVWQWPIIWHKPGGGMLGDSTRGPRRSYELILFATRGDKRVTGVYLDTIIEATPNTNFHAAAKPVDLYINLLRRSCTPGDKVLDPTCGSGTIFPAANKLRLLATGIEGDEAHYNTALRRMDESVDV